MSTRKSPRSGKTRMPITEELVDFGQVLEGALQGRQLSVTQTPVSRGRVVVMLRPISNAGSGDKRTISMLGHGARTSGGEVVFGGFSTGRFNPVEPPRAKWWGGRWCVWPAMLDRNGMQVTSPFQVITQQRVRLVCEDHGVQYVWRRNLMEQVKGASRACGLEIPAGPMQYSSKFPVGCPFRISNTQTCDKRVVHQVLWGSAFQDPENWTRNIPPDPVFDLSKPADLEIVEQMEKLWKTDPTSASAVDVGLPRVWAGYKRTPAGKSALPTAWSERSEEEAVFRTYAAEHGFDVLPWDLAEPFHGEKAVGKRLDRIWMETKTLVGWMPLSAVTTKPWHFLPDLRRLSSAADSI